MFSHKRFACGACRSKYRSFLASCLHATVVFAVRVACVSFVCCLLLHLRRQALSEASCLKELLAGRSLYRELAACIDRKV